MKTALNFLLEVAIIAGVVFVMMGCGRASVDPAFDSYVQAFESDARAQGIDARVDSTIRFGTLGAQIPAGKEIGLCETSNFGPGTITIDQTAWNQRDDVQRKMLVYHELGHCVLHRKHSTAILASGYPASIMNPDPDNMATNFDYNPTPYQDELFAGAMPR